MIASKASWKECIGFNKKLTYGETALSLKYSPPFWPSSETLTLDISSVPSNHLVLWHFSPTFCWPTSAEAAYIRACSWTTFRSYTVTNGSYSLCRSLHIANKFRTLQPLVLVILPYFTNFSSISDGPTRCEILRACAYRKAAEIIKREIYRSNSDVVLLITFCIPKSFANEAAGTSKQTRMRVTALCVFVEPRPPWAGCWVIATMRMASRILLACLVISTFVVYRIASHEYEGEKTIVLYWAVINVYVTKLDFIISSNTRPFLYSVMNFRIFQLSTIEILN